MEVLNTCAGATARYKCCAMGLFQPPAGKTCSTLTANPSPNPADALAALEPGATYTVVLNPALAGRNSADKVLVDDKAKALLTFTTEPFKALNIAGGNAEEPTDVDSSTDNGDGSAAKPYLAGTLVPDEPIDLELNAGVDATAFTASTATAKVSVDGAAATDVAVAVTVTGTKKRIIDIAPSSGSWATVAGASTAVVTITLKGAEIRDISQVPGHPAGKGIHVIGKDLTIRATVKAP